MSHKGGKMNQMVSLRLKINEHMTSVGEEILCVLEKQQRGVDVCSVKLNVRVFVLERLSLAAQFMCNLFQREIETLETLLEKRNKLLDIDIHPYTAEERSSNLVQEEPQPPQHEGMISILVQTEQQPPQIKQEEETDVSAGTLLHRKTRCNTLSDQCVKSSLHVKMSSPARTVSIKQEPEDHIDLNDPVCKEQEEFLQRPEEVVRPILTLLAVKSDGDDGENRDTEPVASTSAEHMKTQAYIEYWVAAKPASNDQLLSSHCSESDITEDSDEWEPGVDQSPLNTVKSHKTQDLKSSKETHSMQSHTGKKRSYICTVCEKPFNRKETLKNHFLWSHPGEKPFVCETCKKGFCEESDLKRHMMAHTGEKPLTCAICNKGFRDNGNLKIHMRTHTGEKPFTCAVCNKGFGQKIVLKRHMLTHTGEKPFTCMICTKGFSLLNHLKQHMRTHTGEKPFVCTVCNLSFSDNGNLKRHMRTHT